MSRFTRGFRGSYRRFSSSTFHNNSSFQSGQSSFNHQSNFPNYTRFSSSAKFGYYKPTCTMTMHPQTPASMVYSSIALLPTMEQGSHLIGTGSTLPSLSEEDEEEDVSCIYWPSDILMRFDSHKKDKTKNAKQE